MQNKRSNAKCEVCGAPNPSAPPPPDESSIEKECLSCHEKKPRDVWFGCDHYHCVECLSKYVGDAVESKSCNDLTCPTRSCRRTLREFNSELVSVLDRDLMNKFEEGATREAMATDESVMECERKGCENVIVFEPPTAVDVPAVIVEKDDAGNALDREAFVHFSTYRLRCNKCSADFCASCKTLPYHKGYTCETFTTHEAARKCRFCDEELNSDNTAPGRAPSKALRDVCNGDDCVARRALSCTKTLACGHACCGVRGERECLPCIHEDCWEESGAGVDGSDFCGICWSEAHTAAPCLKLDCSHVYHAHCLMDQLDKKWSGVKIWFKFLDCAQCSEQVSHPYLAAKLAPYLELQAGLKANALKRLKIEGMLRDAKLTDPSSDYYGKPELYAWHSFAFYSCHKCHKPYCGGKRNCEQARDADNTPPEELVCFDCSDLSAAACTNKAHKEFLVSGRGRGRGIACCRGARCECCVVPPY